MHRRRIFRRRSGPAPDPLCPFLPSVRRNRYARDQQYVQEKHFDSVDKPSQGFLDPPRPSGDPEIHARHPSPAASSSLESSAETRSDSDTEQAPPEEQSTEV